MSPTSSAGVGRRSFLVTLGGAVLGTFFLPRLPGAVEEFGEASAETNEHGSRRIRRLLSKPIRKNFTYEDRQSFFLLWTEVDENDEVQSMIWTPQTPEETAEAERFYEAARNFMPEELKGAVARGPRCEEERALIQAVLENPDEEDYLLKYAWWLEGQGDPQGEFIRLCREIDGMSPSDPSCKAANDRWRALLDVHAKDWLAPLAALGLQPVILGQFYPALWLVRGVVEEVEIDKPILPEQAEQLFEAAPLLHRLEFNYDQPDVAAIVSSPQLRQITSLGLSGSNLLAGAVQALVDSPHLASLRELNIGSNRLGPEAALRLAESMLLSQLRKLEVSGCDFGLEGVRALVASPGCAGLEALDLANEELGEEGARLLAESPYLGNLRLLRLSYCNLGPEGVRVLASSPHLANLATLDLEFNSLGDAGAIALAESHCLTRLSKLVLSNNDLGDDAVAAIARSANFAHLEQLDLSRNAIGDAGIEALAASANADRLTTLELRENRLSARAAQRIAESPHLAHLRRLDLYENKIGGGGAKALAASAYLRDLETLNIETDNIGQAGRTALERRWGEDVLNYF